MNCSCSPVKREEMMQEVKALNVAIVGGGFGCKAIMDMMFAQKLSQLRMKLIAVACTNPKAVGYLYAREKGIYTTQDYQHLYKLKDLHMIIELTGHEEVANKISQTKPSHVRLMDHVTARLFWDVFQIEEERISERKRAERMMGDNIRRMQIAYDQSTMYAHQLNEEIAERKRAEGALKESEKKYRTQFEQALDAIFIADAETGILIDCNYAAAELVGRTKSELVGKHQRSLHPPEEVGGAFSATFKEHLEKKEGLPLEAQVITKNGDIRDVSIKANIFELNGKKVLQGIFRDITDHKRAEEALRESEEKYRRVLEGSPDPIVVYDMAGKVIYLNPAFTQVFGWTPEELLGKEIDYVPDENWPETQMMIDKVLAGESLSGIQSRRYTKQRNIIDVRISVATYVNHNGSPIGSVHTLRDITERKRLEARFHQGTKMEAIGTLAGGIAHDFNNLLMGIQGHASLMLLHLDPNHPHFERFKRIEDFVKSGAGLTKQLLGFARGGKYEVKLTNLNELIQNSSEMFARTKKEIQIHRKFQKDIWPVEVDLGQLEQVLLNLYVNAWQAMPGGGDLYIQTSDIVLDEKYSEPFRIKPGNYVKISVTDTGVGMDNAIQQRIFDPFFTTKDIGRGTGLGLASAYGIIKNHGGIINVYSKRGEGTTFNIYLPASENGVPIKDKKLPDEILKGTETVLLVDDEDGILDIGEEMLKEIGYEVWIARGGKEAIEIYSNHKGKIDVVILDMIMPDMNGGKAYDRMKEINPNVKVLLSSGYSINGKAAAILKRGCDGFIQKPFTMQKLSKKIRNILDKA